MLVCSHVRMFVCSYVHIVRMFICSYVHYGIVRVSIHHLVQWLTDLVERMLRWFSDIQDKCCTEYNLTKNTYILNSDVYIHTISRHGWYVCYLLSKIYTSGSSTKWSVIRQTIATIWWNGVDYSHCICLKAVELCIVWGCGVTLPYPTPKFLS